MIELKNIHKSFGKQAVLRGVTLTIPKGKIMVIIGPSGCGKTVLLRHIIGLITPDSGSISVDGERLDRLTKEDFNRFRRRFGMLFQQAALFDSLTVFDNVAFPLREQDPQRDPKDIAKIVVETLRLVGLEDAGHKMPDELSGGMKKRVGLARAIVLKPKILLYDEPTTGLDPLTALSIDNLILSMQQTLAITSVIISHDIASSLHVADRIAMLHEGKIIADAPPAEFEKISHPVVREFLHAGKS